ncbi:MAG: ABC transporter permease [Deltaproteobacteria bacterium]|nr:ABC transporter permease [Deltaproteobacteria bacterium]
MVDLFLLAVRNVVRNTRRSAITFIAVLLAVAIMLAIRGFLTGLQDSMRDMVVEGQLGAIQVYREGYRKQVFGSPLNLAMPADETVLQRLRDIPHVRGAGYRLRFGGMVSNGDTTVFAMLTAVDPARDLEVCPRRPEDLASGALPAPGDPGGAVLDVELARKLGVGAGKNAVILAADREGVLNGAEIHLTGTMSAGKLPGMEAKVGLVTLAAAQELLRMPGLATELVLGVDDLERVDEVRARVVAVMGQGYETAAWYESASFVKDMIAIQNAISMVVSGIFLVVALLGVANTMLMSVLERTREVGTMLSVGMRRRRVRLLFLVEAGLLALVGAVSGAGVAVGLVLHWRRAGLDFHVPLGFDVHLFPRLTTVAIVATVMVTCLGALLSALWPAWKASRLRPVEALAHV